MCECEDRNLADTDGWLCATKSPQNLVYTLSDEWFLDFDPAFINLWRQNRLE